mgnify:FL=1
MTNNGSHRRHVHLPRLPNRHRDGDGPSVSPGWYDDPTGRFEQRYWDGEEWTTEVIRLSLKHYDLDEIDLRILVSPPVSGDAG